MRGGHEAMGCSGVRHVGNGVGRRGRDEVLPTAPDVATDCDDEAIRLAIFDLDRTLTAPDATVLRCLGRLFDFATVADAMVDRFERRTVTNADVSTTAARYLRGRRRAELVAALDHLPMAAGIPETVAALQEHGVRCAIATLTFDFAAEHIADVNGFDVERVLSTALGWTGDDRATGSVLRPVEPVDKVAFMDRLCAQLRIERRNVMVVGDSHADVPAMRAAGLAVGVNAGNDLTAVVDIALAELDDLVDSVRDRLPA